MDMSSLTRIECALDFLKDHLLLCLGNPPFNLECFQNCFIKLKMPMLMLNVATDLR